MGVLYAVGLRTRAFRSAGETPALRNAPYTLPIRPRFARCLREMQPAIYFKGLSLNMLGRGGHNSLASVLGEHFAYAEPKFVKFADPQQFRRDK